MQRTGRGKKIERRSGRAEGKWKQDVAVTGIRPALLGSFEVSCGT